MKQVTLTLLTIAGHEPYIDSHSHSHVGAKTHSRKVTHHNVTRTKTETNSILPFMQEISGPPTHHPPPPPPTTFPPHKWRKKIQNFRLGWCEMKTTPAWQIHTIIIIICTQPSLVLHANLETFTKTRLCYYPQPRPSPPPRLPDKIAYQHATL